MAFPFQNSSGGNYPRLGKENYMQLPRTATYNLSTIIFNEHFIKNALSWTLVKLTMSNKECIYCYAFRVNLPIFLWFLGCLAPQHQSICLRRSASVEEHLRTGTAGYSRCGDLHCHDWGTQLRGLCLSKDIAPQWQPTKSQISTGIHFVLYAHGLHQIVGWCQMVAQHRAPEPVLLKFTVFSTKFLLGASSGL